MKKYVLLFSFRVSSAFLLQKEAWSEHHKHDGRHWVAWDSAGLAATSQIIFYVLVLRGQ